MYRVKSGDVQPTECMPIELLAYGDADSPRAAYASIERVRQKSISASSLLPYVAEAGVS